jgi:hypothetical protein
VGQMPHHSMVLKDALFRKHFEINKYGVFTKLNNYIMNDYIVHGNYYFKKKLLFAWLEFEIVF